MGLPFKSLVCQLASFRCLSEPYSVRSTRYHHHHILIIGVPSSDTVLTFVI
jgi:hypothetical protein